MRTTLSPSYTAPAREPIVQAKQRTLTLCTWMDYPAAVLIGIGICLLVTSNTSGRITGAVLLGVTILGIFLLSFIGKVQAVRILQDTDAFRWYRLFLNALMMAGVVFALVVPDKDAAYYTTFQITFAIFISVIAFRLIQLDSSAAVNLHSELTRSNANEAPPMNPLPVEQLRILATLDHACALHLPENKTSHAITRRGLQKALAPALDLNSDLAVLHQAGLAIHRKHYGTPPGDKIKSENVSLTREGKRVYDAHVNALDMSS